MSGPPAHNGAIAVGASAGGVDALVRLVRRLPIDLAAPLLVVVHVPASGRSLLPPILAPETRLTVRTAVHGDQLRAGEILVAPPDRHLLVAGGRVVLGRGPKENGARPAIDPTFRAVAAQYGPGAVAVVLSGARGDGSEGARAVAAARGTVLIQHPRDAEVASMPEHALAAVGSAAVPLTAGEIGATLGPLQAGAELMQRIAGEEP